ncbi:hypothetical protein CYY_004630 [Polysphondylium violaceum]|uniref:Uncharacterized protein n=1 Tax=Polysphondylium violaceum TaxID=133409 RepID=A0A8J4PV38_9MYCE|nr:hypothetical protein CYY_004630 [Polysphondylium violaceum]
MFKISIIIILLIIVNNVNSQCALMKYDMPPMGSCEGPMSRAILRYNNMLITNKGCAHNKIKFYKENMLNTTEGLCGTCKPGTVDESTCNLNEYCNDEGECESFDNHPFLNVDCPYQDNSMQWCGVGLSCINHKCMLCRENELDQRGRICIDGKWSLGKPWSREFTQPTSIFVFIIFLLFTLRFFIYPLFKYFVLENEFQSPLKKIKKILLKKKSSSDGNKMKVLNKD